MALVPIMCRYGFLFPVSCLGLCQQKRNRHDMHPHTLAVSEVYLHSYPYTTRDCWSEVQKSRYLCVEFHVSCILCYMFHVAVNRMYMPGFMFLVSCFQCPVSFLGQCEQKQNWRGQNPRTLAASEVNLHSYPYTTRDCWSEVQKSCYLCGEFHVSCIPGYMFHVAGSATRVSCFMMCSAVFMFHVTGKKNVPDWFHVSGLLNLVSCFRSLTKESDIPVSCFRFQVFNKRLPFRFHVSCILNFPPFQFNFQYVF